MNTKWKLAINAVLTIVVLSVVSTKISATEVTSLTTTTTNAVYVSPVPTSADSSPTPTEEPEQTTEEDSATCSASSEEIYAQLYSPTTFPDLFTTDTTSINPLNSSDPLAMIQAGNTGSTFLTGLPSNFKMMYSQVIVPNSGAIVQAVACKATCETAYQALSPEYCKCMSVCGFFTGINNDATCNLARDKRELAYRAWQLNPSSATLRHAYELWYAFHIAICFGHVSTIQ